MAAAFDHMHCGDLVPDSTVREMLRERSGWFPRTLRQEGISYHPVWKSNSCDTEHFPRIAEASSALPREIEHMLPPPPDCTHVVIGGHFVLLTKRTNVVVDVFHFEM